MVVFHSSFMLGVNNEWFFTDIGKNWPGKKGRGKKSSKKKWVRKKCPMKKMTDAKNRRRIKTPLTVFCIKYPAKHALKLKLFNQMILMNLVQRFNLIRVKKISHEKVSSRRKITHHIIIFFISFFGHFFPQPFLSSIFFAAFFFHGHFFLDSENQITRCLRVLFQSNHTLFVPKTNGE